MAVGIGIILDRIRDAEEREKRDGTCSRCGGEGTIEDSEYLDGEYESIRVTCPKCGGSGIVS